MTLIFISNSYKTWANSKNAENYAHPSVSQETRSFPRNGINQGPVGDPAAWVMSSKMAGNSKVMNFYCKIDSWYLV